MSQVTLHNISHSYGKTVVLDQINLSMNEGEIFTLLGPSGCGKTTLLRILAGFISPSKGQVLIGDKDITSWGPEKRDMGIVFQNYALFPNMTVEENIAYGLKIRKKSKSVIKQTCEAYMELSGLTSYAKRKIQELSGGQQQRVAIARALAIEPKMLLLDEPMSNLDVALRVRMREEIREIQQKIGITTLFITHDQQEALAISDQIAVMNEGKVLQCGTPKEIYNHPKDEFVANFVGISNRYEKNGEVRYIRPEQIALKRGEVNGIKGRVCKVKFAGMYYEYEVEAEGVRYHILEKNLGDDSQEWKVGDVGTMVSACF